MDLRYAVPAIFLSLLCAQVARAEPAQKFNPGPWLEDFTALKAGMEDRYANLAWFGSPAGGVDLPGLERHTRKALESAGSPAEARQVIKDFVGALGDGHFSVLLDDPPAGDAHAEPAAFKADPADPATGCAALGFGSRGRIGFSLPFESLPGFRLESDGVAQGFRAGVLPARRCARHRADRRVPAERDNLGLFERLGDANPGRQDDRCGHDGDGG